MIDTHFKSEQNQFLHLDTKKILSSPQYILIDLWAPYCFTALCVGWRRPATGTFLLISLKKFL